MCNDFNWVSDGHESIQWKVRRIKNLHKVRLNFEYFLSFNFWEKYLHEFFECQFAVNLGVRLIYEIAIENFWR